MLRRTLPSTLLAAALGLALLPLSPAPAHADPLIPLPPPGQPVATSVTATGATLTWARPDGPVFRYSMQRLVDGEWQGWLSMPGNSVTLAGLTPDTAYTVAVRAAALADSGYTTSPLSEPLTFTTLPEEPETPSGFGCTIGVTVDRYGGYQVRGNVTWSGPEPAPRWRMGFTIATTVVITQVWNATVQRSGTAATLTPADWDGPTVPPPPGGPYVFGFSGRYVGAFVPPSDFRIGDTRCTAVH
ncbi:cellulose binding domain-containing protein [Plantactinospora sonchi]|uniref:Cellulose binding domain-containing protein n=1 Tax=Plantactinospora sonchi TaxID=1544735 RepID=A0ABU7RN42_9ACTN